MSPAEIHLCFWPSTDLEMRAVATRGAAFLDASERRRATRFLKPRDAWRFQASRIFLRSMLARYAATTPRLLPIKIGDAGKPFICSSLASDVSFSLSHCGCSVALAVGRGVRLGVDIEEPLAPAVIDVLVRRFFTAQERCESICLPDEQRTQLFLAYWTLKEAYGKAIGTGLVDGLRATFTLRDQFGRIHRRGPDGVPDPDWRFMQFGVGENECLSMAWDGEVAHAGVRAFRVTPHIPEDAFEGSSIRDVRFSLSPLEASEGPIAGRRLSIGPRPFQAFIIEALSSTPPMSEEETCLIAKK